MENVMENVVENVTLSYHIKLILPMYSEQQSHSTKSQISGKLWLSDPSPAQRDRWKLMAECWHGWHGLNVGVVSTCTFD